MSDRLTQLRRLHDADPGDAFVTYAIAMEMVKLGQDEQALPWLDKTLAIDSGYCYAYYQKGKLLSAQGQTEQARAALAAGIAKAQAQNDQKAISELRVLLDMVG